MIDMTGKTFGALTVIGLFSAGKTPKWLCRCVCGKAKAINAGSLPRYKSCGCLKPARMRALATTHGKSKTPTYRAWRSMVTRCTKPSSQMYPLYGARGITVCERWMKFENFYADMGDPPMDTSLDRIDNSGNYEPSNCRWADIKTQIRNRRNTLFITLNGITKPLGQWAEEMGVDHTVLWRKYRRGRKDSLIKASPQK